MTTARIAELENKIHFLENQLAEVKNSHNEPENRYRTLFERALDAVYILDMKGNFLDINQTAIQLMGYSRQEALGLNFFDLIPEEQSESAFRKLADSANYDIYRDPLEFRVRRKDGTWIWIETKAKIRFEDGLAAELRGIAVDITEKKLAREALAQREEQYRAIFEAATDAFFLFDLDGNMVALNPSATELYGYQEEELAGRCGLDLTPEDFHPVFSAFLQQVRTNGRYFSLSRHPRKNGSLMDVEVHGIRFLYQGKPHILASIRDISERVRMEKDLLLQKKKTEQKSRHLEETNTALRVLVRQREADREELARSMVANVQELVLPYLEELAGAGLKGREHALLTTAISNLDAIASPFVRQLSSAYHRFTPMEIRIANLVRHGRSSKEIADILSLSKGTVDFHRNNIRSKLGIKNAHINLRTHLLSLSENTSLPENI
ncbi:PAS domain S-box protein [Desulfobotulus sp. H1]|uniref:histidine kinase n=1 Tax=Desulfobotulus pelophilus TaxID=2823377 RepID=A0ABT3NA66_9BACT|nr:PAS domain S-box protein [Desulfobotulus pelophilus]MCW7754358.1 PAS domain S-box protein [Desulfobotulus pelophilus]